MDVSFFVLVVVDSREEIRIFSGISPFSFAVPALALQVGADGPSREAWAAELATRKKIRGTNDVEIRWNSENKSTNFGIAHRELTKLFLLLCI